MARQAARCPHCDAEVHPQARECPECGAALRPRRALLPVMVGVAGVVVALAAGAGVWVLLAPGAPSKAPAVATELPAAPAPAPQSAPPPAQTVSPVPPPPALPPAPAQAATQPPTDPAAAPNVADAPLPLPTPSPEALPAADETARRDFARATQENFTKNGLDLKVSTTGQGAKVISLVFNFPAKMAVELIAGGPFPRQCRQRGFSSIAFSDPSGAAWTYDIATDKLTAK